MTTKKGASDPPEPSEPSQRPKPTLEELGLEIEEIPKGENPWKDPRFLTVVPLLDRRTGRAFYFKIPRVHIPNYRNRDIHVSGILEGLSSKALWTAWTLCEQPLERHWAAEPTTDDHRDLLSDHTHLLVQIRQIARAMRARLEDAIVVYRNCRFARNLHQLVNALEEFTLWGFIS